MMTRHDAELGELVEIPLPCYLMQYDPGSRQQVVVRAPTPVLMRAADARQLLRMLGDAPAGDAAQAPETPRPRKGSRT